MYIFSCFIYEYADHRDLHVRTHTSPTRRSSDLVDRFGLAHDDGPAGAGRRVGLPRREQLVPHVRMVDADVGEGVAAQLHQLERPRSEEHTSELQSLMRNSYAVFSLKTTN